MLSYGWPTNGNPIYLFIAFVPLLYVEEYYNRYIFLFSIITFLTWNFISTWWLHYTRRNNGSFSIESFIIPSLLNSILMSIIFTFYSIIKNSIKNKNIGYMFLICSWILFEKIHLEWELSWPWLTLGNGFSNRIKWIQWYEYTGTLGGSIWIWIVNINIIRSIVLYVKNNKLIILYKNIFISITIVFIMIIISNIIYNNIYIEHDNPVESIVLQPNIDPYNQKYKISTKKLINKFKKLIDKKILKNKPMIIIAPETSFPIKEDKFITNNIRNNILVSNFKNYLKNKSPKTIFITGLELLTYYNKYKSETSIPFFSKKNKNLSWIDFFNSVIQIDSSGKYIFFHHKNKLVPAVEFFPYKNILFPIIGDIILNFGGNSIELGKKGGYSTFKNPYLGIKIAPIICYESIFGEYVSNFFKKNANLLVIITNDGWWGNSQGCKQHLYYSRLRAIENRKCIARSANTGISCFIDEKGEINSYLPYGKEGVLYKKIYSNSIKTFYTKYGDFLSMICFIITIIIIIYTFIIYKYFIKKI
ncbi:apolipoprotein N-acyltransferase [Blattabacterium cuenoti]|uniref:apolipoprotein N-acyltransferase n=1 Tax=Blattabacterium cuenoti TaxID=1653831 RepID=UPI001EECBA2A|nr:apolipoprotein N-acyltransferase [Blattabacterium cuenoti]